ENFQENLLFLLGTEKLSPVQVHVLLATVKTIINEPELQNNQADRAIATQKIVRQVHSEVTELDERELLRTIDALFVKRFGLFTPDRLEDDSENVPAEIDDYWEVHPDFNEFAQNLVNYLVNTQTPEELSEIQKVNRVLLTEQFMSPKANPQLWSTLAVNKQEIAEQWAQGGRFVLEIGDRYALLLDTQRQPSVAKPYLVALAVAHQLGAGVAAADLTALIRKVTEEIFSGFTIQPSQVKAALLENDLMVSQDDYWLPTPIVERFLVTQEEDIKGDTAS
ncbi:hypothetical protein, partial [Lacticaseibacillus rhamnosus]